MLIVHIVPVINRLEDCNKVRLPNHVLHSLSVMDSVLVKGNMKEWLCTQDVWFYAIKEVFLAVL